MKTHQCAYDHCRAPALLYPCGPRCQTHTPAQEAGHPEPPDQSTTPPWWIRNGRRLAPTPLATSYIHDHEAIRSGRRVSGERRRANHAAQEYQA